MPTVVQTELTLSTAHVVDACVRLKIPYRIAPVGIRPVVPISAMISAPVVPVRHYGSVDIFLEVIETHPSTGILVIDNEGRTDEACIGDLAVLEVKNAGFQGIVVWGLHRDTKELIDLELPVFSYGSYPAGPCRLDAREPDALVSARFADFTVTAEDTAFLDQDGVVFIETQFVDAVLAVANTIRDTEREQVKLALQGTSLRDQFQFAAYLKQRESNKDYTFRQHLTSIAKAIEE